MNRNETELRFDLLDILRNLKKKIWYIVAATVIFAVVGMVVSRFFIPREYTSSTRIYVLSRKSDDTVVSSDFQVSNYMINDYKELIRGRNVTSEVIKQLNLNMSTSGLAQKISIYSPPNTRILQINVTDTDPHRAQQIANAVREVASAQLKSIMQVDSVTTIYEASFSSSPSSPNVGRNTMQSALIGLLLSVAVFLTIYFVDDRIRSEEDVERYLNLSIMGVIPDTAMLIDKGSDRRKTPHKGRGIGQWK